jgi:transmembrane 9 superfamily member 2/4
MQSKEEKHFIHNHFTFLVKYHKDDTGLARIVAFEVKPYRCNIVALFLNS